MKQQPAVIVGTVSIIEASGWTTLNAGQLQLAPVSTHGQPVTPVVNFAENGSEHRGPGSTPEGPLTLSVGAPLVLTVWLTDDSITRRRDQSSECEPAPLPRLTWHLHQGPTAVGFADEELAIAKNGPTRANTTVTLTEPGEYLLRALATDRSGGGGSQCC